MIGAEEGLARLRAGNARYVADSAINIGRSDEQKRQQLVAGQQPFAIILGCSDSRVPAEMIFDQGLGALFVVRVAGNVVTPAQQESIEFAATQFGSRLVVVLGHSGCGAVQAALAALRQPAVAAGAPTILSQIRPAVAPLLQGELRDQPEALLAEAVRANIRGAVAQLRAASPVLRQMSESQGLIIAGAEYELESGVVEFFEMP